MGTQKWGVSSAGRAPALQAGGHRFDPGTLHQKRLTEASGNRGFIESLEDSKMYLENWTLTIIDAIYEKATVKENFLN